MPDSQASQNVPPVRLSLEMDSSMTRVLDERDALHERVRQEIAQGLAQLLGTLGIPGVPDVKIVPLPEGSSRAGRFLRVRVNDHLCRYSGALLQRVYSYATGVPRSPEPDPAKILTWLEASSNARVENADVTLVEFLRLACLEIVKQTPAALLGTSQVAAYQASMPEPSGDSDLPDGKWPPDPAWLLPVLLPILNLKISIADRQTVVETLKEGLEKEQSQAEIAEDLIIRLSPSVVEIQLHPETLREMTLAEAGNAYDKFTLLRDGLFYELGMGYPDFRFVPARGLRLNSFTFKINHMTMSPAMGLPANACLANDTRERLRLLNIEGTPAINPTNDNECTIIPLGDRDIVENNGWTTWDAMGYLVLSLAADLRFHSACFLHRQAVENHLDQLETAFPALVKTARRKVPIGQITQVLRALVTEDIAIRDLRSILEQMLDYDYIVIDPARYMIFDDRLPTSHPLDGAWFNAPDNLAAFVRIGMKRYISHKYTRGQSTLIAYSLHSEIEGILSEHQRRGTLPDERQSERILEAVGIEVEALPATASPLTLLTTIEVRPTLRDLVAPEFPRLHVLAYEELSPDLRITSIARIALDA